MGSLFDGVKDAVSVPTAARFYGHTPNRSGFIRCPFHMERTPSLRLYERTFHCFGCGTGGSVIDFVSALFNLNPLEAARKIDADFNLHLAGASPDYAELDARRQIREARELFDEWREQMLNRMDVCIRMANLADYERMTDAEAKALRFREALEYWADILMHGKLSEQMAIFRDRKDIESLCGKILEYTPKKWNTA